MIWGMTLEPGKLYTETMGEEVQLSMAAIDSRKDLGDGSDRSFSQIVMETSKGEYVLCTLIHGVMFQQNLDLKIMPREKVTFSVQGSSVVYLVGYTASYPEDEEFGDIREEDLDASEDSSAWEAVELEDSQVDHIKEEPIEITEEQSTQDGEFANQQGGESPSQQEGEAPSQHQQQKHPSVEPMEGGNQEEQEEIVFSVSDLETDVKTEAPDSEPSHPTMQPQMTPQEAVYTMPVTDDNGAVLQQTSTEDYFYPETQQQPEVPPTPIPDAYQPPNSAVSYPQANPQGVLTPAPEQFLPPQRPPMQRSHAGPMRHPAEQSTMQPMNTQRNYPPQRRQRRQYGTNRSQPTGKSRSVPQPMNVQRMRNVGNVQHQQQSMPGPSQQDVPGPSTSGQKSKGKSSQISHGLAHGTTNVKQKQDRRQSYITDLLNSDSVKFVCKYCGKQFSVLSKFRVHENYHQRAGRFKCGYCEKTFHSKSDTRRHERIHTGEKPYKCNVCSRGFAQITNRNLHEAIHYK